MTDPESTEAVKQCLAAGAEQKQCTICNRTMDYSQFNRNTQEQDGYKKQCKFCVREVERDRRYTQWKVKHGDLPNYPNYSIKYLRNLMKEHGIPIRYYDKAKLVEILKEYAILPEDYEIPRTKAVQHPEPTPPKLHPLKTPKPNIRSNPRRVELTDCNGVTTLFSSIAKVAKHLECNSGTVVYYNRRNITSNKTKEQYRVNIIDAASLE